VIDPRIEELLEDLYLKEAEDPSRAVRPPAAGAADQALAEGLLSGPAAAPRLTDQGREAGRTVVRRHRLAERLLSDVLGMRTAETEGDACRFEHILQDGLDERVCTLLGHPQTCPHGHPIPRGACCLRAERDALLEVGPLCDGRPGQSGVVAYLSTRDNREIQKLMAMGILPGSDIRLVRRFPSYIFEIGHSQFTVDVSLAEKIFVHWRG
jgi:DtxR family Mn-dependent transcriptional regulator